MTHTGSRLIAPFVLVAAVAMFASAPPARAFDAAKPICTLAGLVSGVAGKICSAARHPGTVLKAGQKLLGGHLGGAVETLSGAGSTATKAITARATLAAMAVWVLGGARLVLHETAGVISATTRPQLQSTWFSSSYWRMAGISALLTLPFVFAAAIQALLRGDISLLARSALGYLPLGALAVAVAAPLAQLLLAASDELSGLVSSASGYSSAGFVHVTTLGLAVGAVSTFPMFFIGLLAVAATVTLWIELLIRSAAVYVIVLMLPLFFAALVWPARRIWAVRAIELLVALILSKFAIVAVLALGGAALGHTTLPSLTQMLAGTTLVMLAAFSPWALLRLLPLHELAAGVEGMRGAGTRGLATADTGAVTAHDSIARSPDELGEGRPRPGSPDTQSSGARSAIQGLNADQNSATGSPSTEDRPAAESAASGAPADASEAPAGAPEAPATTSEAPAATEAAASESTAPTAYPDAPGTIDAAGPAQPSVPDAQPPPLTQMFSETASDGVEPSGTHWTQRPPLELGPDTPPDARIELGFDGGDPGDDREPR